MMLGFGAIVLVAVPIVALFLRPSPEVPAYAFVPEDAGTRRTVLGLPPNLILGLICAAGFIAGIAF